MPIFALHHVQLAMPPGGEDAARAFYAGILGMTEVAKPLNLARRGGCWFAVGNVRLHLGVEAAFQPARKAHPALVTDELSVLAEALTHAGIATVTDEPLEGFHRFYAADPFGNRIEFLQPLTDPDA